MNVNSLSAIWLSRKFPPTSTVITRISEFFPTVLDIYNADEEAYRRTEALDEDEITALLDKDTAQATEIMNRCLATGVEIICYDDPKYPKRLKTIENPPVVLYCIGKLPDFDRCFSVSVVGSRDMSPYGAEMCARISSDVAVCGGVIVSGLALGIDAMSTAASLFVGGTSVAIVAFGVDVIYPKTHSRLRKALLSAGGAIISEYPPGTPFHSSRFRERNRLFGGISNCTLIIEGKVGSGTGITASHLLQQNKPVYVVPSNLTLPNSELTLDLMKHGVKPVGSAYDIFVEHEEECFTTINAAKIEKKPQISVRHLVSKYSLGIKMSVEEYSEPYEARERKRNNSWLRNVFGSVRRAVNRNDEIDYKPTIPEMKKENSPAPTEEQLRSISDMAYQLYQQLSEGEKNVDDLMLGRPYAEVLSALTMLELHGYTQTLPGNKVKIK